MLINLILIAVGLTICFGGIYFRRVCSGLLGLVWGILGSLIVILMTAGLWGLDDEHLVIAVIVGIAFAIFCGAFYKLAAAINSFVLSFSFAAILIMLMMQDNSFLVVVLAAIIAIIVASISYKFYDYSFIIVTALTGGFIASVGAFCLVNDTTADRIITRLMWSGLDGTSMIWVGTIVLGAVGFYVQLRRLGIINGQNNVETGLDSSIHKASDTTMPKIGDNVASVASDIGSQVKSAWTEISNSSSALDLKEQLMAEKILLIAPLVSFIVMPLIYFVLNRSYYGGYGLYQFLDWVNRIAESVTIGTLVYFAISKNDKFNLTFSAIYSVAYLLFHLSNLKYMGFWPVIMCILKYPICWLILKGLSKAIHREDIRPVVFTACAFLFMQYIFSWITYFYFSFYFSFYVFASLTIEVATVYLIFKKRHDINIFQFHTV